ncbi:MAG: alpha-L-fucosidase, partial [Alistipes sp.]|nr:alpha-L-fucosidase [Alistipes sp.]
TPAQMYPGGKDNIEVLAHGQEEGERWAPAEADVSIRPGWFYHDYEKPKTPEKLFDIYLTSVGRGGTLLLNLAPDRRGRVPEQDIESLMAWRKMVDDTFANDLAAEAKVSASSSRGCSYGAKSVVGQDDKYWATEDGVTTGDITLEWNEPQDVKYVTIQEHIALGQRVRSFEIDVMRGGEWQTVAKATTVGYKRIVPIEGGGVEAIKVRFTDSRAELAIARVAVY